jgi:hypothetical protein
VPFSAPKLSHAALGIGYSGLTGAGIWFIAEPSQLLQTGMGTTVYVWAVFLVLGGVLCLAGTLTKLWIGEFTGLILLFFGNLAWASVLVGASATPSGNNTSAKYGIVLVSLAMCAFAYRWGQIREKVRNNAAGARSRKRRGRRPQQP